MEQVLIGGYFSNLSVTTTLYNYVVGGNTWNSNKDLRAEVVSTAGTLRNLRVKLDGVPGTGTYTFTLYRRVGTGAWAATALTCTVAADGTLASDTVNNIAVAAGDVICLECNPDSPDSARKVRWSMMFEGDTARESLLLGAVFGWTTGTRYDTLQGGNVNNSIEDDARQVCPTAGTIKKLYVQLDVDPGTSPDAYRITVRLNGATVGESLIVTVTADDLTGNDTAHNLAVVAGDILTVMVEPLNSPATGATAAIGMTFLADTDGESIIMGGSNGDLDDTATEYNQLIPLLNRTWVPTESQRYQLAQSCTLKKLYVKLSTAPGAGKKYTFTVRIAGDSNVVAEVTDTATTGNSGALEDTVANDDDVTLKVVPDGTPTVADAYWGLVSTPPPPVSAPTVTTQAVTDIGFD